MISKMRQTKDVVLPRCSLSPRQPACLHTDVRKVPLIIINRPVRMTECAAET